MKSSTPPDATKVFLLSLQNTVVAFSSEAAALRTTTDGDGVFATLDDLNRLTADWPSARLVHVWNNLPDAAPVKKFTDRPTALKRIWTAVQVLEPVPPSPETPAEGGPATGRAGTKKALLVALLQRPAGASVAEIMQVLNWQSHSVRGYLSTLAKKGASIQSFRRPDGERAYTINHNSAAQAEGR